MNKLRFDLSDLLVALQREGKRKRSTIRAESESQNAFEQFLLSEYSNIAQAHFNTVESLSNFVKHYILIASAPIYLAVIFMDVKNATESDLRSALQSSPLLLPLVLTAMTLIGLFVLNYVINIRCDTLLYARTVNGIRKYFYNHAPLGLEEELKLRTLPKSLHFPAYFEGTYFLFVVLVFTVIGTSYFTAGWYFYWATEKRDLDAVFWTGIGACVWLHLFSYVWLSWYREKHYLRGHIVGVDIDGVLNDHRLQFARVLKTQVNKEIDPDSITRLPVHEIPGTDVTADDEQAVFNWGGYWSDMPPRNDDVGKEIGKIKNLLGFQVWVFTHRGWPQVSTIPQGRENQYWASWVGLSCWACLNRLAAIEAVDTWLARWGFSGLVRGRLIRSVTKRWLFAQNVKYDRLIIEKGNTNTTDPLIHTRNRFLIARDRHMRAFVEDDLIKAKKLSNICEVVFLIDHPYNQCEPTSLPTNIIRVKSWREIYTQLRELF